MRKILIKTFSFLALLSCFGTTVFASPIQAMDQRYSKVPTIGTPAANPDRSEVAKSTKSAVGIVSYCDGLMRHNNTLTFYSETYVTHLASKIGNPIFELQVWNGYDWSVVTGGYYYEFNRTSSMLAGSLAVASGKYYRVAGSHLAIINNVQYSTNMNYSDYIYVP